MGGMQQRFAMNVQGNKDYSDCAMVQQRMCNTQACPTRIPTSNPTPVPTPMPTTTPTLGPSATIPIPVLVMNGLDVVTLEAAREGFYHDLGATCSDAYDGQINGAVKVAGEKFPELRTPGTYAVKYTCTNSHGRQAQPLLRTVTVRDSTCPTCTLNGSPTAEIEASFPYTDAGATCTDTLDGALTAKRVGHVDVESTGTYRITYTATDAAGNSNDGCATKLAIHATVRTVVVMDTLKPVIGLQYAGSIFHTGAGNDHGKNGEINPAKHNFRVGQSFSGTPLMAQVQDMGRGNAWLVAGVLSALAGVVLLVRYSSEEQLNLQDEV
jgi:hypothetical protein